LSTFGIGLESILPKTVNFSKYQTEPKGMQAQNEILGNINGKLDFVVIVSFLLGLFGVLYAGTMICGEKEAGTIKLVLSNPAKRSAVITAKFLGGLSVLLIPLAISYALALLLLQLDGFPLFTYENLVRVLALLGLSVLYISALFSLGLDLPDLHHP
jgi:ABC-type transport system involved in multi-copper enzyme maturation permease subunit